MICSRRSFHRLLLGALAALPLHGAVGILAPPSLVVAARSSALQRKEDDLPPAVVRPILDRAVAALTGKSGSAAWRELFSPRETIAVKVSCLPGRRLSSSVGLVGALTAALVEAGVPARNILVWERTGRELERAGFTASGLAARVVGSDEFPGGAYSGQVEISGSVGTCFARVLEHVDAVINVPVLKDHDLTGISCAMKNFYGAIHNPNKYHGDGGDPYIADLNAHPLIRRKCRLVVCDASRVQIHNGPAFFPAYAVEYGGILVSRDPVALDRTGWTIVEELRRAAGLKTLAQEGREPRYIRTAARRGLGRDDETGIRRLNLHE